MLETVKDAVDEISSDSSKCMYGMEKMRVFFIMTPCIFLNSFSACLELQLPSLERQQAH